MDLYIRRRAGPAALALPLHVSPSGAYSSKVKAVRGGGLRHLAVLCILAAAVVALLLGVALAVSVVSAARAQRSADAPSEAFYVDEDGFRQPWPAGLASPATVALTAVVPAYHEETRLPAAMRELVAALEAALPAAEASAPAGVSGWELIIVDDGGGDGGGTSRAAAALVKAYGATRVRLLQLERNAGKGGAVRKGAARARGAWVLMADADGATRASALNDLLAAARGAAPSAGAAVAAVGSRAHLASAGGSKGRSPLRRVLMWGFHTVLGIALGGSAVRDTQCGFKLFSRAAAQQLFPVLHIERWAFDVELLALAARKRIPVVEVDVPWTEMPGSKVNLVRDSFQMLRDVLTIRVCYLLGIWSDAVPSVQVPVQMPVQPVLSPASPRGLLGSVGGGSPQPPPQKALGGELGRLPPRSSPAPARVRLNRRRSASSSE